MDGILSFSISKINSLLIHWVFYPFLFAVSGYGLPCLVLKEIRSLFPKPEKVCVFFLTCFWTLGLLKFLSEF